MVYSEQVLNSNLHSQANAIKTIFHLSGKFAIISNGKTLVHEKWINDSTRTSLNTVFLSAGFNFIYSYLDSDIMNTVIACSKTSYLH